MRIEPRALAEHLSRVFFPGEIREVTLRDQYTGVVKNRERDLIVWLPPSEGFGVLARPVGIPLQVVISSLKIAVDLGHAEIDLTFSEDRMILTDDTGDLGTFRLLLINPSATDGHMDPEVADELLEGFSFGKGQSLNRLSWDEWHKVPMHEEEELPKGGITKTLPLLKRAARAERIVMTVGPTGGLFRILGLMKGAPEYVKDPAIAELQHGLTAPGPYELEFRAGVLAKVIDAVGRVPGIRIHLSGPGRPILFCDESGYQLLLFPKGTLRAVSRKRKG